MNDDELIKKSKKYLGILKEFSGELDYSLSRIDNDLNNYLHQRDKKSRIDLLSSLALFEKYFHPLIERYKQSSYIGDEIEKNIYKLNIDRHWRAYEFKELFNAIDYYHKIYAIKQKVLIGFPESVRDERYFYYRYALLHHYLFFREELTVQSIEYASPGNINFEGLGEVIRELRQTVDWIISAKWIEKIIINFYIIRDREYKRLLEEKKRTHLRADVEYEKNRLLEEKIRHLKNKKEIEEYSCLKKSVIKTKEEEDIPLDQEKYFERVEDIADNGIELEDKKIASLPQYEEKVILNAKRLHRLGYKNEKISKTNQDAQQSH